MNACGNAHEYCPKAREGTQGIRVSTGKIACVLAMIRVFAGENACEYWPKSTRIIHEESARKLAMARVNTCGSEQ